MTAWRQLHQLDPQRRATPIPLELEFPWGKQRFWGTSREYLWARGLWAPKPLSGAYLALEGWALRQLDAGRQTDAVIEDIVRDNESVAAVGVAVAVAIRSQTVSETTLPLFTTQRLWKYDLQRKVQEASFAFSSTIGFHRPGDRPHAAAVQTQNAMPFRQYWIRDYIPLFLIRAAEPLVKMAREKMESFATALPYEYEEQKAHAPTVATLSEDGRFNAEFGKSDNVKVAPVQGNEEQQYVYIDNPLAREPELQEQLTASMERQHEQLLWFWANKSLEGAELVADITPDKAIERGKKIDNAKLFRSQGRRDAHEISIQRGAVAGVAAVILKYPVRFQAADIKWARQTVERAAAMPEEAGDMWSNGALIPWHPGISAARGLGFDVRAGQGGIRAKEALLRLVAHPVEVVALAALNVCFGLWDIDPRLGWCALWESLALCQISIAPMEAQASRFDPAHISARHKPRADEAIKHYKKAKSWPALPAMPEAWKDMGGSSITVAVLL